MNDFEITDIDITGCFDIGTRDEAPSRSQEFYISQHPGYDMTLHLRGDEEIVTVQDENMTIIKQIRGARFVDENMNEITGDIVFSNCMVDSFGRIIPLSLNSNGEIFTLVIDEVNEEQWDNNIDDLLGR